ncbi:hypothetical protein [Romboutsia sp.]|uniref:hypothetical protein n=1 Tax=Romboutsia sp. TaxID=1965302 RepID=UPI003F2C705D
MIKSNIKEDLELLSKDLYLESPDLWIEFLDKINDGVFDELVLFLATKYNHISIIKYAIENNLIDLNSKSKNKDFANIYEHLFYSSKQSKHKDVYNFLNSLKNSSQSTNTTEKDTEEAITEDTIPYFVCPNCKSNIFESGYIICENKVFKFSSKQNKPIEVSSSALNPVICNSCNCVVPDATPEKLELLCSISRCANCSEDLRTVGILDNTSLVYDAKTDKFVSKHTDYSCQKCNHTLKKEQEKYFNLRG